MSTKTIQQLIDEVEAAKAQLQAARDLEAASEASAKELAAKTAERDKRKARAEAPKPKAHIEHESRLAIIAAALRAALKKDSSDVDAHTTITLNDSQRLEESVKGDDIPNVHWTLPTMRVAYRGADVPCCLRWEPEYRQLGAWRQQATGRLRMVVGGFGESRSYPPRKDGSYDYDAAASHLFGKVIKAHTEWTRAQTVKANANSLQRLKEQFKLGEHSALLAAREYVPGYRHYPGHENVAPEGKLLLRIKAEVTPEQAEALLTAAAQAGLKLS